MSGHRTVNYTDPWKPRYCGSLADRPVPPCPRCGYRQEGWNRETVGLTYAGCPRCGKLFNR